MRRKNEDVQAISGQRETQTRNLRIFTARASPRHLFQNDKNRVSTPNPTMSRIRIG